RPGSGSGGSAAPRPPDPAPAPEPAAGWRLAVQPDGPRALRLDSPAVPGATAYEIARDDDGDEGGSGFITQQSLDSAATSFRLSPLRLVDSLRHSYRVRACLGADCSLEATAPVNGDLHQAADLISGSGLRG